MNGYDSYIGKYEHKTNEIIINSKYKKYLELVALHMNSLAERSIYNYIYYISDFLDCSNKDPEKLNIDDYNAYMKKKSKAVSSTQILCYHALKYFSEYMYISGHSDKDWISYIKRPKAKESRKTIERRENSYLNENEIKRYIENVKNSKFYENKYTARRDALKKRDLCLILIMLTTGLRSSAICKLDIHDINLKKQTITVTEKGDKVQTYDISDSILESVSNWEKVRAVLDRGNTEAFFLSEHGERLPYNTLYDLVRRYGNTIGRDKISPHKLRASYGTMLYEKTKDIYFVSQAMGHSGTEVTKRYIRGKQETIRQDASKLMGSIVN